MKKIIKSAMLLLCSAVMFTACSDDNDANPTIQIPESFVLNTPAYANTAVDLGATTEINFTWNQPDYGFPAKVDYQLQVSKDGNFTVDLATVAEGEETTANYATLSDGYPEPEGAMRVSQLSPAINSMFGWDETTVPEEATVYVRALAETKGAPTIYSNVVTIKVKPSFNVAPSYDEWIYVPGNGQGWSPESAAALRSADGDGIYTGFAYIDGDFKFTKKRDWTGEYNFENFTSYPAGWEQGDGTNINCPEAGVFYMKVDVAAGTVEATKINNMNLVGDFNGWNAADDTQQMTWNAAENCYEFNGAAVTDAGWKFTANNDWGINLGGDDNTNQWQDGPNNTMVGTKIKLFPLRDASENIYYTIE